MESIYHINYQTKLNRLETKKEGWTGRANKKVRRHKLLIVAILCLFMLMTIDILMLMSFVRILQSLS